LKQIQGLSQLPVLALQDTDVTNSGLEYAGRLTKLVRLDLTSNQVAAFTDGRIKTFQQAVPNCTVVR